MKFGIIISIILGVLVIAFAVLFITPPPDEPTQATREQVLRAVTLPEDMPALFEVTRPNESAMPHLEKALSVYEEDRLGFEGRSMNRPVVEQAAAHLIAAARAGQVPHGFIDKTTPIRVGGGRIDTPLLPVASKVMQLAREQILEKKYDEARLTVAAVFSLGHRAFIHNDLLSSKQFGMTLMTDAGAQLFELYKDNEQEAEKILAAADGVNTVYEAWEPKLRIVLNIDPHVGDLLNIARNDQDRAFRIAATAQLGLARFTDSNAGNHLAIEAYLKEAMAGDDPLLAQAATAASEMTREEVRKLR